MSGMLSLDAVRERIAAVQPVPALPPCTHKCIELDERRDGRVMVFCWDCCDTEVLERRCPCCRAVLAVEVAEPGIVTRRCVCGWCVTECSEVSPC